MAELLAGAAEVVITPPVGTCLEGYGARDGGIAGVHDDLHARALVVDDGTTQAAIVSCDLIGVDRRLRPRSENLSRRRPTFPPNTSWSRRRTRTPVRRGMHRRTTARCATSMAASSPARSSTRTARTPRRAEGRAGSVDSVSQNRRDPDGPIDDALRVLLFDSPVTPEPPVASIVNFACHPTVLYHTNMQISADYPGYAMRTVREIAGASTSLFLNGACGDVNPAWIEQDYARGAARRLDRRCGGGAAAAGTAAARPRSTRSGTSAGTN